MHDVDEPEPAPPRSRARQRLSARMRLSLMHLAWHGNLEVGNYRLQKKHTYVPSNTFRALERRGLAGCFHRSQPGGYHHIIAFITDEGRRVLAGEEGT